MYIRKVIWKVIHCLPILQIVSYHFLYTTKSEHDHCKSVFFFFCCCCFFPFVVAVVVVEEIPSLQDTAEAQRLESSAMALRGKAQSLQQTVQRQVVPWDRHGKSTKSSTMGLFTKNDG